MRFPGMRKTKHYFPVEQKAKSDLQDEKRFNAPYVLGLEQLMIDIEIKLSFEDFETLGLNHGQSTIVDDERVDAWYSKFKSSGQVVGEYAGGSTGNTLHNYSTISDSPSVALGCINENIKVGDYSFQYIRQTSSKVNMQYLQAAEKPIARALCFITPDFERTFAISKGCMNDYEAKDLPLEKISKASLILLCAYTLRDEKAPLYEATLKLADIAKEKNIPVAFSLGSRDIIAEKKDFLTKFIKDYVNIIAMNEVEASELSNQEDQLLACRELLEICDFVLLTSGANGLYVGAYTDQDYARKTKDPLHTKSIVNYNEFEYSRAMLKSDCEKPIKIFNHINPFLGGPQLIQNTNGAGDAALAAVMHDIVANAYHALRVPQSPKHERRYLTYSSISQVSKYANRVSYEVLAQNSPRLVTGLPEKEDSLEEAYWDK